MDRIRQEITETLNEMMNTKPVLWTADWCMPCKPLKVWVEEHYPDTVEIKDVGSGAPNEIKSLPTLQMGEQFVVGNDIKRKIIEIGR